MKVTGGAAALQVTDSTVYLVISVRNVGTGLAVMHGWHIDVTGQPPQTHPPLEHFIAQNRDIYVASGDIGFWQGALRDPAAAQFKAVAAAAEAGDPTASVGAGSREPRRQDIEATPEAAVQLNQLGLAAATGSGAGPDSA